MVKFKYDIAIIDYFDYKWIENNKDKYKIIDYSSFTSKGIPKGHGIAVTYIITRINKNARIVIFSIDKNMSINMLSDILNYIANNKIAKIINLSFGFVSYKNLKEVMNLKNACKECFLNNIKIITSNSNNNKKTIPGVFKEIILVDNNYLQDKDVKFKKNNVYVKRLQLLVQWVDRKIWVEGNSFYTAIISSIFSLGIDRDDEIKFTKIFQKLDFKYKEITNDSKF
ncbi:MAG: hypothetical protein Q4B52_05345 [Tissierellia bacterium]|nr:hypothetical protein [Tissierellia bacterium]